jgi:hypothetical protein
LRQIKDRVVDEFAVELDRGTSRTSIGYSLVLRFKQVVIKIKHLGLRAEPEP